MLLLSACASSSWTPDFLNRKEVRHFQEQSLPRITSELRDPDIGNTATSSETSSNVSSASGDDVQQIQESSTDDASSEPIWQPQEPYRGIWGFGGFTVRTTFLATRSSSIAHSHKEDNVPCTFRIDLGLRGFSFRGIVEEDSGAFDCSECRNARILKPVIVKRSGSEESKNDRNRASVKR